MGKSTRDFARHKCGRAIEGEGGVLGGDRATDGRDDGLVHLHPPDEDDIGEEGSANLESAHGPATDPVEETPDERCEDKGVEEATDYGGPVLQGELEALLGEVPYLAGQRDHVRGCPSRSPGTCPASQRCGSRARPGQSGVPCRRPGIPLAGLPSGVG